MIFRADLIENYNENVYHRGSLTKLGLERCVESEAPEAVAVQTEQGYGVQSKEEI